MEKNYPGFLAVWDILYMKILFIFPATYNENDFGGMHKFVSNMAKYYHEKGDEVVMVFLNKRFCYPCYGKVVEMGDGITSNVVFKVVKAIHRCYKLNKVLGSEKSDVIYNLFWLMPLLLFKYRKKTLSAFHSNPFFMAPIWQFIVKNVFTLSNKLIVPSYSIARMMTNKWGVTNVIGVNNPIDFNCSSKKLAEVVCVKEFHPYIVSVCRLMPLKNLHLLIAAYELSKMRQFASLVIIGDGELRDDLANYISLKRLETKVHLLGMIDNPLPFVGQSLFFVSSSLTEACPLAIGEAQFCGVPIVSAKWFGSDELIIDGINGLLVQYNDKRALAEGMDRMYFDITFREKCKNGARNSIKHLSLEKIMRQYDELFYSDV